MNFSFTSKSNASDPEALREQIKASVLGFVEQTIFALKNRTIHAYHSESTGCSYIIHVCRGPNVIPSLTNLTCPYTANMLEEHVYMLIVCYHLDRNILDNIAFAETIIVEVILHNMGAISIISRVGKILLRSWKIAHKIKLQRERLDTNDDVQLIILTMFGAYSGAASKNSYTFVSLASIYRVQKYGLRKKVQTVKNCKYWKESYKIECFSAKD
ncbi:urease subunit alpha [Gigaspora margarita]|uniref:Urease subunit alpha n=1 Tax=Gigaspora margarita TaxID=4874 RepID=A0A8H3X6H8_GIGMA|nr:urease subunit alpha [Gigaspora margarita]